MAVGLGRLALPVRPPWLAHGNELELQLIQPQMAQKPLLRGEVRTLAGRVRAAYVARARDELRASVGGTRRLREVLGA